MKETVGEILIKARENKKITLQTAADETKITSRHIKALEENNFGIFPGDTYTVGFIKKYAAYLDLEPDKIVQIYRGTQLIEKDVPLHELTRPTVTALDHIKKYAIILAVPFLIIIAVFFTYYLSTNKSTVLVKELENKNQPEEIEDIINKSNQVPLEETEHIKFRSGFTTALIPIGKGIDFSIENVEVYLVLKNLNYGKNENKAYFELFPGRKKIEISENAPIWVEEPNIPRKFRISLMGATPNTVKVQIDQGELVNEEKEEQTQAAIEGNANILKTENFIIRFEAVTTAENFIEICIDGKPCKRDMLGSNTEMLYEANDSIQMKIGDAGAIKIKINNKSYDFGKRGVQVSKIIRKVRDPMEQTKYKIIIKDL
ncbi:MAG: helix-turn-helix domain-containing protein [Spirochaetia bacterium]|nr:helix-turn-helix domain-containing protein [Spirochaetia bacterium]